MFPPKSGKLTKHKEETSEGKKDERKKAAIIFYEPFFRGIICIMSQKVPESV